MDQVILDDKTYITSKRAATEFGYTQDYIGQLCRGGQIDAKRVSGQWYIFPESLSGYKSKAESFKPEPPKYQPDPNVEATLKEDGREFVSAALAAKITQYNQDYVGQLARAGKIPSKQVGNRWYVDRSAIIEHKKEKDALLRAVQAESVGLARADSKPIVVEQVKKSELKHESPLMHYQSDATALFPVLEVRTEAPQTNTAPLSPQINPPVDDASSRIQIKIVEHRTQIDKGFDSSSLRRAPKEIQQHKPAVSMTGIPIFRATVLAAAILVSVTSLVGIFALGGARIIATINSSAKGQTALSASSVNLTQLDRLLTKEIVYVRQN